LVRPPEGSFTADRAREAEAESLARWLATEVIARVPVVDRNGREAPAAPCDVAILTRSLTEVHVLLDALRRWKIRYVVEGEKHFFATQDVVDAVNLLRTVSAPDDATALVGLLRSPLGGVNDRDLYELARAGLLDYRMVERPTALPAFAPATLYRELLALHRAVRVLAVGDAVSLVFDRLPLVLVAAAGRDADQAVANLEKLRRLAEALAADGARSLSAVIRLLDRRVREEAEEGESPLADEQVDAVKVMSVHKAKGLEFPIVVLIGAHAGIETGRPRAVAHHWSSGGVGLQIGDVASFTGVFLTDQLRRREAEEQNRLVYVAMTRARERFVVSAAPTARPARDSVLKRLEEALGPVTDGRADSTIAIGKGAFRVKIVSASPAEIRGVRQDVQVEVRVSADAERFLDQWRARRDRAEFLINAPRFLTPTRLARRDDVARDRATTHRVFCASMAEGERARRLGTLVHRFLQYWDYGADPSSWWQMIERSGVPDAFEDRSGWFKALETVLAPFFASSIYRELAAARILGREVPLILPWEGAIMEGVIDLIYEREGRLYVADYKSDAINPHEAPAAAEQYRRQAEVYTRAVRESLGREVTAFRCLFLRLGTAVDLVVPSG
jgi:ATP-dependent helicase/nuclease subunit A